jgi:hypothetical protein
VPSLDEVRQTTAATAAPAPLPVPIVPSVEKPLVRVVDYEKRTVTPDPRETASPAQPAAEPAAKPGFGHAEDYAWVCGQLEHFGRTWRLRYASLDEEDPHGGSVTLATETTLDEQRNGQFVRLHGHLVDPDSRASAPAYRVDSIDTVNRP